MKKYRVEYRCQLCGQKVMKEHLIELEDGSKTTIDAVNQINGFKSIHPKPPVPFRLCTLHKCESDETGWGVAIFAGLSEMEGE